MLIPKKAMIITIRAPALFPQFQESNFNNKIHKVNVSNSSIIKKNLKLHTSKSYVEKMKNKFPVFKKTNCCFLKDHDNKGNTIDDTVNKIPIDNKSNNKRLNNQSSIYNKSFKTSQYERKYPLFKPNPFYFSYNSNHSKYKTFMKSKSTNGLSSQEEHSSTMKTIDDQDDISGNSKMRKQFSSLNKFKLHKNFPKLDVNSISSNNYNDVKDKEKENNPNKLGGYARNYRKNSWFTLDVPLFNKSDKKTSYINSNQKANNNTFNSSFFGKRNIIPFDFSMLLTFSPIPSMKIDYVLQRREKSYKHLNKFDYIYKSLIK